MIEQNFPRRSKAAARTDRLAQRLRDNLAKRKAQARSRTAATPETAHGASADKADGDERDEEI